MPIFEHNGVQLSYLVEGYGKAILLLHNWTCDMHDWSFQIPMLVTRGFTTIAMDMRGHGRSSSAPPCPPPSPSPSSPEGDHNHADHGYTLDTLVDDVTALLGHLGVKTTLVAGHGAGAILASVLAVNHPDLVEGLILINPAYYLTERERTNLVAGLQTPDAPEKAASLFVRALYTPETPAHLKAWHTRRARCTTPEAVGGILVGLFSPGCLGLWDNMKEFGTRRQGPRLVICSTEPHAVQEHSFGSTDLDRIDIVAAGAWPHQQAAEQVNNIIVHWLDDCEFHG